MWRGSADKNLIMPKSVASLTRMLEENGLFFNERRSAVQIPTNSLM